MFNAMIETLKANPRKIVFTEGHDARILEATDRLGSLRAAAAGADMAYSKAWNVLRLNESEFGIKFINRNGAHGSELTPEGRAFLEHYQEMELAAERAAQEVFDKYFR